jgi:alpha-maltose-1-phosphate synthase
VASGVPRPRIVEVPFGIDTRFFTAPSTPRPGRFRLAFVGRLELLKGLHYLLQAWSSLGLKEASLTLVGPVLPEIQPLLATATSTGSVEVLGQLSRERVRSVLHESHAVVFPSICDAFGLVMLEAMASGRPVVATSRSAGPDVISDGVDGFVVPPKDVKSLAERIEWLYLHREECDRMGRHARAKIESRYDLSAYGDRLVEAYTEIIAGGKTVAEPALPDTKGC